MERLIKTNSRKLKHHYVISFLLAILALYSPFLTSILSDGLPIYLSIWDMFNIVLIIPFMCFVVFKSTLRLPPPPFIIGIFSIILARILSLNNFQFFQLDSIYSVFRYVEVFVVVIIWINLLHDEDLKVINTIVLAITFLSTSFAIAYVVLSHGISRAYISGLGPLQIYGIIYFILDINNNMNKKYTFIKYIGILYLVIGILLSLTRGLWITFGIALLITILLLNFRARIRVFSVLLLLICLGYLLYFFWPQMQVRVAQLFTAGGTIGIRLILWQMSLAAFRNNPLIGIGSGQFARNYPYLLQISNQYLPTQYWSLSTHSEFLEALAETGIIGFIAYFIYFICMMKLLWSELKHLYSGFNCSILCALAITLIALIISDFYAQGSFNMTYMLLLILFILAKSKFRREKYIRGE